MSLPGSISNLARATISGGKVTPSSIVLPGGGTITGSAGSISLMAAGSNQNINLKPSGTGDLELLYQSAPYDAFPQGQGIRITPPNSVSGRFWADSFGTGPGYVGRRAQGTFSIPSAVTNGNTLVSLDGWGFGATVFSSAARGSFAIFAQGTWTDTNQTTQLGLNFVPLQTADNATSTSALLMGGNGPWAVFNNSAVGYARATQWGVAGVGLVFNATTFTDTSGTGGTVATTAIHALRPPTLAASVATTYTDVGTLKLDPPVQGPNATITNLYSLINTGNTLHTGTLVARFGSTAQASIGVSADTTAGVLTLTAPSAGTVSLTKSISSYNGLTTAGQGVPVLLSAPAISATKTANFTAISLTPAAVAGQYRVDGVITTTSATNTGTVQFTVDYVDSQGITHTADVIPLVDAAGAIATTKTGASKEYCAVSRFISVNNSATAIVLKVVITGSVSYTVAGSIERVV